MQYDPNSGEMMLSSNRKRRQKRDELRRLRDMALASDLMLKGWTFEKVLIQMIEVADRDNYTYSEKLLKEDIQAIKQTYLTRIEANTTEYRSILVARIQMERAEIWKWIQRAEEDEPIETSTEHKEVAIPKVVGKKKVTDDNGVESTVDILEATTTSHDRTTTRKRMRRAPVGLFERLADLNKLEAEVMGLKKDPNTEEFDDAVWRPGNQKVMPYQETADMLAAYTLGAGDIIDVVVDVDDD